MDLSLQHCDREKSRLAIDGLRSYGQLRMSASGVSMLPTILPGDSLLIERAALKEVIPGDIVLYSRGDSLFIHRLIQLDREGAGFVTRGDSMAAPDPAGPKDLLGKVPPQSGPVRYSAIQTERVAYSFDGNRLECVLPPPALRPSPQSRSINP